MYACANNRRAEVDSPSDVERSVAGKWVHIQAGLGRRAAAIDEVSRRISQRKEAVPATLYASSLTAFGPWKHVLSSCHKGEYKWFLTQ